MKIKRSEALEIFEWQARLLIASSTFFWCTMPGSLPQVPLAPDHSYKIFWVSMSNVSLDVCHKNGSAVASDDVFFISPFS